MEKNLNKIKEIFNLMKPHQKKYILNKIMSDFNEMYKSEWFTYGNNMSNKIQYWAEVPLPTGIPEFYTSEFKC